MINYEYTNTNRLQEPHKYMYTPFQGKAFINAYITNRNENIKRFESQANKEQLVGIERYLCDATLLLLDQNQRSLIHKSFNSISAFGTSDIIYSKELLLFLLGSQLSGAKDERLTAWLNFLIQRFEVSKKLYETYHPNNIRKGLGDSKSVILYWLFSLLLILSYSDTKNIKYLSTCLKINDLLCSLNDDLLSAVPKQGLYIAMSTELKSIKFLLNDKGVSSWS